MRRILPLLATGFALLALPSSAHAILFGVESNAELINSTVTPASQATTLDNMRLQGVRVVRINMGWNEVATPACASLDLTTLRNPDNGCYSWVVFDGVVQQASARGIQVLATVSRAPQWLHGNADPAFLGGTTTQWIRSVQHYAAFMHAAALRYRAGSEHGTIRMWTVWNEPNSKNYLKPLTTLALLRAAPARYAQLFAETSKAIRSANPSAQVALGPTGPRGTIKPITYVRQVQAQLPKFLPGTGATERRFISAWAHNPYPGISTPPSRGTIKSPDVGMSNIGDLFQQLDAAGVTKGLPVWATEFAYQTNPPDEIFGTSPALQGRFIAESFDWLDSKRRVTVAIWYGFTDPTDIADWQGGTYFADGTPKVGLQWWRRPISVPVSSVRRGGTVRIWARSMVNPSRTQVAWSTDGRTWRLLPIRGKRADGTIVTTVRMTRTMWFATFDGTRGPARRVIVN